MRRAAIKIEDQLAGWLTQNEQGYHFVYDHEYVTQPGARPVSLTLPLREATYASNVLFPFFDSLILEGWLLDITEKNWKLNPRDRMGLLLARDWDFFVDFGCRALAKILPLTPLRDVRFLSWPFVWF